MKPLPAVASKLPIKFRIPTAENLVPIRLDIEIDGQRFKDAFTWNPTGGRKEFHLDNLGGGDGKCWGRWSLNRTEIKSRNMKKLWYLGMHVPGTTSNKNSDPDSEVVVFAKRTVKDLKLPPAFITQIAQSIQSQLTEFRSLEGQEMYTGEKLVPLKLDLRVNNTIIRDQFLWDLSNIESDPEEFARTFCEDLGIEDLEVGPAIAVAIREQLYEIAVQNVTSARESRVSKKGRRGAEHVTASKTGGTALDLMKLFGGKSSVIRKRKEWDLYEPIIDILSNEEVDALDAREERNAR